IETFDGFQDIPDRFYIWVQAGIFGNLGGHGFDSLIFVLDDYTHTSAINDSGGGQTLASLLGGPLNLNQFANTTFRIMTTNKTGSAEGNIASLTVISNTAPR